MAIGIEARAVTRSFRSGGGGRALIALAGVDLSVAPGEMLGIVGESGSGKSTLGRILVGLDAPTSGEVLVEGAPLVTVDGPAFRSMRRRLQYVFQDPLSALNPRLTVGRQIAEAVAVHRVHPDPAARTRGLLAEVGLGAELAGRHAHQLSGGQRQRVVLARCLSVDPDAIVFDEAVSALDLSIQAQVIALISRLRRERGLTGVFISHDLRVVRYVSDRIVVMYLGRIVEEGPADRVYHEPLHPYTRSLVAAILPPVPAEDTAQPLPRGEPPDPYAVVTGCAFLARCPHALPRCATERPVLAPAAGGGAVACHAPRSEPKATAARAASTALAATPRKPVDPDGAPSCRDAAASENEA